MKRTGGRLTPAARSRSGQNQISAWKPTAVLARKVDVALLVDAAADVGAQEPMIGRILHLLVIDILAVGLAMRRGEPPMPAGRPLPHAEPGPELPSAGRMRLASR